MEATKTCTKCGGTFAATGEFFVLDRRKKSGLGSWCRTCAKAHATRMRVEHPERGHAASRRYYEANRDRVLERTRKWHRAIS